MQRTDIAGPFKEGDDVQANQLSRVFSIAYCRAGEAVGTRISTIGADTDIRILGPGGSMLTVNPCFFQGALAVHRKRLQ